MLNEFHRYTGVLFVVEHCLECIEINKYSLKYPIIHQRKLASLYQKSLQKMRKTWSVKGQVGHSGIYHKSMYQI